MIKVKGVASILITMLLMVGVAIASLFSLNYVLNAVKLPLAVVSGLLVFMYSTPIIILKLKVGKVYGAMCGAILGLFTSYYIYQLDIFLLTIAVGVLLGVGYFIRIMMEEIKTWSDFAKIMKRGFV